MKKQFEIMECSLNFSLNLANSVTKIFFITIKGLIKGLLPATSCVRNQGACLQPRVRDTISKIQFSSCSNNLSDSLNSLNSLNSMESLLYLGKNIFWEEVTQKSTLLNFWQTSFHQLSHFRLFLGGNLCLLFAKKYYCHFHVILYSLIKNPRCSISPTLNTIPMIPGVPAFQHCGWFLLNVRCTVWNSLSNMDATLNLNGALKLCCYQE